jgi:hypothetical protein
MQLYEGGKAAPISLSVLAFRIGSCTPLARAASCTSPMSRSALGLFWFTSGRLLGPEEPALTAAQAVWSSLLRMPKPVRLSPGRARLATSPAPIGSAATNIGIVTISAYQRNLTN